MLDAQALHEERSFWISNAMKTLGQVLSSYREKKRLPLSVLAKKTSISEDIVEHLENDDYTNLPAAPLVRGYIILLANEIGLSEETALALYRRDVESKHSTQLTTKKTRLKRSWSFKQNMLTPRFLSLAVLIFVIILGTTYAAWQWFSLSQPPALTVSSPTAQTILSSPVKVSGKTTADNTVTINTEVVAVDINGNFQYELALPPGERAIVVTAEDSRGRKAESITFITVE